MRYDATYSRQSDITAVDFSLVNVLNCIYEFQGEGSMKQPMNANLTDMLQQWVNGDQTVPDQLFPLIYPELKRVARGYMARERANHTLQPTELVNEAFLRLQASGDLSFQSRTQFFAFSARVMRHVLVEHSRAKHRAKRGGGDTVLLPLHLGEDPIQPGPEPVAMLALDEALGRLQRVDDRKGRIVEMWYFAGLDADDVASCLEISAVTVRRELRAAKTWLSRQLSHGATGM